MFKEVNTSHTLIVAGLLPLPPHQAREASPSSSPGYFSRHLRFLKDILLFPECQKKKYLYQETHIAGKKCRAGDIMKGTIKDLSLMSQN